MFCNSRKVNVRDKDPSSYQRPCFYYGPLRDYLSRNLSELEVGPCKISGEENETRNSCSSYFSNHENSSKDPFIDATWAKTLTYERRVDWLASLASLDPRWQIQSYKYTSKQHGRKRKALKYSVLPFKIYSVFTFKMFRLPPFHFCTNFLPFGPLALRTLVLFLRAYLPLCTFILG